MTALTLGNEKIHMDCHHIPVCHAKLQQHQDAANAMLRTCCHTDQTDDSYHYLLFAIWLVTLTTTCTRALLLAERTGVFHLYISHSPGAMASLFPLIMVHQDGNGLMAQPFQNPLQWL